MCKKMTNMGYAEDIEVEGGDGGEDTDLDGGDGDIDLDDEDNDLDNIALH